jgi:hypothetical protein
MRVDLAQPAAVAAVRLMVQPGGELQDAPAPARALDLHVRLGAAIRPLSRGAAQLAQQ